MTQVIESTPTRTVAIYGGRADVRELAQRVKLAVPGGRKLNDDEALALAQTAHALSLNPLNGEIWLIPGSGPMVGIKGLRRAAQVHAARDGGGYWTQFRQIVDPAEMKALAIPENALAYECRLFDTASIRNYAASVGAMRDAGIPYSDAVQMIGERPSTIGIGYWTPGEATKMRPVQCALKRAEADALKRRYHISVAYGEPDNDDASGDASIIDAETRPSPTTADAPAETHSALSSAGRPTDIGATPAGVIEPPPDDQHAENKRKPPASPAAGDKSGGKLGRRDLDETIV
jgi:hypothetical protein